VYGSSELRLFGTDNINFDTLNVSLSGVKCQGCDKWTLNYDLEGPLSSMIIGIARLLCSTLLIPCLIRDIFQFAKGTVFERKLTCGFLIATLLYIDPFFVAQLFFPSPYRQISHLVFRDLYFAGLGFYILRLFAYFTPDEGNVLNSGFPGTVALIILIGLLVQDFTFAKPRLDQLLPQEPLPVFDRLTVSHCYVVSFLCVVVIWRAVQVGGLVPDPSLMRYRYYTISCVVFLFVLIGLIGFEAFTDKLENCRTFVTTAVIAAFALFVDFIHSEGEEFPYGEYPPKGGVVLMTEEEVELGADEDLEQIGPTLKPTESEV
jgi:hypothetical protein